MNDPGMFHKHRGATRGPSFDQEWAQLLMRYRRTSIRQRPWLVFCPNRSSDILSSPYRIKNYVLESKKRFVLANTHMSNLHDPCNVCICLVSIIKQKGLLIDCNRRFQRDECHPDQTMEKVKLACTQWSSLHLAYPSAISQLEFA